MVTRLEARGVSFDYPGPLRAVDGVDLALQSGELAVVIGPNGVGKTTLLKLLAGLARPRAGGVTLDGSDLARLDERERARAIAFVPQTLVALPEVTVEDFVLGGRYSHLGPWRRSRGSDRAAVARALADADAGELAERLLTELSSGQRQRVLVARSLAQEARVLLVDEPTSSLDPEHQLAVFELLRRLASEGRAVLVVTHDLNLAGQFATRIVLLDEGRVHADGAPGDVLCERVLEPVYGPHLRFGALPDDRGTRPVVVPWRRQGR